MKVEWFRLGKGAGVPGDGWPPCIYTAGGRAPGQCCERHLVDMTTHWIALAFVLHGEFTRLTTAVQ